MQTGKLKTKSKDRSTKGMTCLVLIRSGVVSVIASHYTPFTHLPSDLSRSINRVFSTGQHLLASLSVFTSEVLHGNYVVGKTLCGLWSKWCSVNKTLNKLSTDSWKVWGCPECCVCMCARDRERVRSSIFHLRFHEWPTVGTSVLMWNICIVICSPCTDWQNIFFLHLEQ